MKTATTHQDFKESCVIKRMPGFGECEQAKRTFTEETQDKITKKPQWQMEASELDHSPLLGS